MKTFVKLMTMMVLRPRCKLRRHTRSRTGRHPGTGGTCAASTTTLAPVAEPVLSEKSAMGQG